MMPEAAGVTAVHFFFPRDSSGLSCKSNSSSQLVAELLLQAAKKGQTPASVSTAGQPNKARICFDRLSAMEAQKR